MLCLDKIIISNDDFATYNTLLSENGLYLERNDKKARIVINPGYGIQIDKNVGTSGSPIWNNTLYIDSNGELKLNTYDTTISTLDGKITNNSSAISINSQQISSVVSSVSSLDGRVSSAESSIIQNANAITSKVSSTDYNGNRIVSLINQSSSKINMSALNINLSGMVTFNELDDYLAEAGSTTINGANITTGSIRAIDIRSCRFYGSGTDSGYLYVGTTGGNSGDLALFRGSPGGSQPIFQVWDDWFSIHLRSGDGGSAPLTFLKSGPNGTSAHGSWSFNNATVTGLTIIAVFG